MATKLNNLKIKKVDFVDEGANPEADILIYKNKEGIPHNLNQAEIPKQSDGILQKLVKAVGKALKLKPDEIGAALEEVEKGNEAETFSEKLEERSKGRILDEIWDLCFALQSSLCSIVVDETDNKKELMDKSLEEFQMVMSDSSGKWASGVLSGVIKKLPKAAGEQELAVLKSTKERIESLIEKSEKKETIVQKEGEENMIDKNLMTPAEKAFYEDIEKRCSSAKTEETPVNGLEENPITKAAEKTEDNNPVTKVTEKTQEDGAKDEGGIYKGLHPVVAAELKELRKRADAAEEKELLQIAKKYEIIGKKPEELVPMLKNLKHTNESAYNDTIGILDATLSAVNKSGIFEETGKSGHGSTSVNSVETKISGIAKGYMEKNPSMDYNAAVAKAWEDNQDLINEYEEEAGF